MFLNQLFALKKKLCAKYCEMNFLFFSCIVIVSCKGAELPPNFKKCNRNQIDLQQCLQRAAEHSISQFHRSYKELNLPTVEPLEVLEMSLHVDRGAVNLQEHFTNCKFYGLSETRIKKFVFNLEEKFLKVDTVFPKIDTSCNYQLNGTLFGLGVYGQGPSQIHIKNFHVFFHMTYSELRKDNQTYVKIATSRFEGKPEDLKMNVENLFNGDQVASEFVNNLINHNWSQLYDDVKDDYLEIPNQFFKQLAGRFFSKLSLEELLD